MHEEYLDLVFVNRRLECRLQSRESNLIIIPCDFYRVVGYTYVLVLYRNVSLHPLALEQFVIWVKAEK